MIKVGDIVSTPEGEFVVTSIGHTGFVAKQDNWARCFDLDYAYNKETPSSRPKCECGQSDDVWVKHSDYCPLYARE